MYQEKVLHCASSNINKMVVLKQPRYGCNMELLMFTDQGSEYELSRYVNMK